ncbi:hypothetical protein FGO68_gene6557 [Halteria grandinella]|uniref:Uncharacterized protein n=1 Tax=Halteria grandinella TaxID=5974 RepID=A0A8J8SYH0_HALGN|nr:hypothetical protein FGO68_gene6557 [Halteria grandinella]
MGQIYNYQEWSRNYSLHKHQDEIDQYLIKLKTASLKFADYKASPSIVLWKHYERILFSISFDTILQLQNEEHVQMLFRLKQQKIDHLVEETITNQKSDKLDILEDQRPIQEINQAILAKLNSALGAEMKEHADVIFIMGQIDIISRDLILREQKQTIEQLMSMDRLLSQQQPLQ